MWLELFVCFCIFSFGYLCGLLSLPLLLRAGMKMIKGRMKK